MVKPATKHGKGTAALPTNKSSWNLVDASTGKTKPRTEEQPLTKNLLLHILSLLAQIPVCPKQ